MSFLARRPQTLVAAVLVLPLLVSAFAIVLPAHDHSCSFSKGCLTCRSAAEAATELVTPSSSQTSLPIVSTGIVFEEETTEDGTPRSATSRGPPPSA